MTAVDVNFLVKYPRQVATAIEEGRLLVTDVGGQNIYTFPEVVLFAQKDGPLPLDEPQTINLTLNPAKTGE